MSRFPAIILYVAIAAACANCFAAEEKPATPLLKLDKTDNFFDDWGVGLALVRNSKKAVSDATITSGIVRANQSSTYEGTLLVARHFYPFREGRKKCGVAGSSGMQWSDCLGGMVGVGIGSSSGANSQFINFIGIGLTVGGGIGDDAARAWHLGLGVGRKFNVKTLGDGFAENAAPPAGETQVRYQTKDITAPFAYFTAHW